MELRVLAALTRDPRLVTSIRNGVDLHAAMAASIFGVPVEDVTKEQRNGPGKTTNFAVVYGQTWHGLHEELGVTPGQAMNMLVAHQRLYPRVWAWRKHKLEEARRNGGLLRTWVVGRRRCLPSVCGGPAHIVEEAERKLINHQVQSLAADIMKIRLRRIFDAVGATARVVLFAHDEVVLECPAALAAAVLRAVVAIAEKPVDAFCVPLKVSAVVGNSWADKK
jgi:DNA polymerase-1